MTTKEAMDARGPRSRPRVLEGGGVGGIMKSMKPVEAWAVVTNRGRIAKANGGELYFVGTAKRVAQWNRDAKTERIQKVRIVPVEPEEQR